jgi:hypothetical protein
MKSLCTTTLLFSLFVIASTAYGGDRLIFKADLSGAQEVVFDGGGNFVPGGVDTDATGKIDAKFDKALTEVAVNLRIKDLTGVFTRAHFHCGRPGQNGPIAFGLVDPGPLAFDGQRVRGTLTNTDFTGVDCMPAIGRPVNNIAALAFAMRDGLIYANVHSTDFPPGEIRGQMIGD